MALAATEEYTGGFIRNGDMRPMLGTATAQGKLLQFAPISVSASGQTALVNAPGTNLVIYVVSYVFVASSAVSVKFQSGNTDLTGAMSCAANSGVVAMGQPSSHLFQTAANTALNINLGGAVQVSGHLAYFIE